LITVTIRQTALGRSYPTINGQLIHAAALTTLVNVSQTTPDQPGADESVPQLGSRDLAERLAWDNIYPSNLSACEEPSS